jgi:hypothetical protein
MKIKLLKMEFSGILKSKLNLLQEQNIKKRLMMKAEHEMKIQKAQDKIKKRKDK